MYDIGFSFPSSRLFFVNSSGTTSFTVTKNDEMENEFYHTEYCQKYGYSFWFSSDQWYVEHEKDGFD